MKKIYIVLSTAVLLSILSISCKKDKTSTKEPGEPELVWVEGGTFTMGCTHGDCDEDGSDLPAHEVTLGGFYMGKYEVTQGEWRAIMEKNPSKFRGDNLPVECVSWKDAQVFIAKLNANTGKNYRLPTEAEWEYAARGGKKSNGYKYSGSNNIDEVAWYDEGNYYGHTHLVGTKKPNELGIYDMTGNVWELCSDWYGEYSADAQTNPTGPAEGDFLIIRGGSFLNFEELCRVSSRGSASPDFYHKVLGFRLVLPKK